MSAVPAIARQMPLLSAAPPPDLRPYQERAVNEILACIERRRHTLFALPTGGGKSVVLAAVCRAAVAHLHGEVWLFAHRRELIRQLSEHLTAAGLPDHGIISPEYPLTSDPVQVCSIDTVRARFGSLCDRMERVGLMIIDEAHHASSASYSLAMQGARNAIRLGCTATPFRYDGKPLGEMFDEPVRGPGPAELETMGYLAPVRVIAPPAKVNLAGVKKRMGDFVTAQIERAVNTDEVTQAAIIAYAQHCGGVPTIAYCTTVRHAEDCARAFAAAGWSVAVIEGTMAKRDRDRAILGLARGDHQVLFSVDCVSEGVDVPVVGAGLSLRPTASTGLFLQQIGRLRRIYPGKTEAIWLDIVGNWSRHGMPNADRPWSLTDGVKGLERAVAAVRRCGSCHHVCERGPERCPSCGRKYPVRIVRPGAPDEAALFSLPGIAGLSAQRVAAMRLGDLLPLAKTRADLESIAAIRGYKRGWIDHVMAERMRRSGGGFMRRWN